MHMTLRIIAVISQPRRHYPLAGFMRSRLHPMSIRHPKAMTPRLYPAKS